MSERPVFVGGYTSIPMSQASQAGIAYTQARTAYDHAAFKRSDDGWINLSTTEINDTGVAARQGMYAMLDKPASWYLQPLQALQPRSYAAFFEAGEPRLVVLERTTLDPWKKLQLRTHIYLDTNERLIAFGDAGIASTYSEMKKPWDFLLAMPQAISQSWLWRINGWKIPREIPPSPLIDQQMITQCMRGFDAILDSFNFKKGKRAILARYLERFPDMKPLHKGSTRYEMRCFLDTRPEGVGGPVGDQFFVLTQRRDELVYHLRNGDVDNLRLLDNPAEAIDHYHEHLLLKRAGEFDFSPWSVPFTW